MDVTTGLGTGLGRDIEAACRAAASQALAGDGARAEGLRHAGRGVRRRPAARRSMPWPARCRTAWSSSAATSAGRDFVPSRPSYQFCATTWSTDDGVAVLLFSGPVVGLDGGRHGLADAGRDRDRHRARPGAVHEIDDRPAIEFLARYLDVTGPASFGNPLAVVEAGG